MCLVGIPRWWVVMDVNDALVAGNDLAGWVVGQMGQWRDGESPAGGRGALHQGS